MGAHASTLRRLVAGALLWAGPLGLGLAVALLLASAPWFRAGPDAPPAGDVRAWNALWGALALVAVGCLVGVAANLAWLARASRRARRVRTREWLRAALHALLALAGLWIWLRG